MWVCVLQCGFSVHLKHQESLGQGAQDESHCRNAFVLAFVYNKVMKQENPEMAHVAHRLLKE